MVPRLKKVGDPWKIIIIINHNDFVEITCTWWSDGSELWLLWKGFKRFSRGYGNTTISHVIWNMEPQFQRQHTFLYQFLVTGDSFWPSSPACRPSRGIWSATLLNRMQDQMVHWSDQADGCFCDYTDPMLQAGKRTFVSVLLFQQKPVSTIGSLMNAG